MNTNPINNTKKPCICFGLTLYNNAKYLPEALDSILNQSYRDFHIVAVDDCSSDESGRIMQSYVKKDNRVLYFRNETWSGMIATWQNAFQRARELFNPDYFAWASDHDKWHPEWLERHLHVLSKHPDAVLAYPRTAAIDANGEILALTEPEEFEKCGITKIDRFYHVCRKMSGAGNKIYGLFRAEPLLKAGVFRSLTMPDRLLLTEISQYGSFRYIPEKLWFRRYFAPIGTFEETVQSQVEKLFGPVQPPFAARFPYIMHCVSLILSEPFDEDHPDLLSRLLLSMIYWESNSKYIVQEVAFLDDIMKKGINNEQLPIDAGLLKSVSEAIGGICSCVNERHDGSRETASALLFGVMLFKNYLSPAGAVRETIQLQQMQINKMEYLVEKYKSKLDKAKEEAAYWKKEAASETFSRLKLMIRKYFKGRHTQRHK
ncbi:MAG: glycosyltransferase family 2 protein [Nitrospirae bacterium]|nr:glycosyltransferase family 2 protein [Nitrospirota bacterium]